MYIYKVLVLGGFYLLSSISSISQKILNSEISIKYLDSTKPINPDFYILELETNAPIETVRRINQLSLRTISDKQYIIEEEKLSMSHLETKFYKHLKAANNLWKFSPAVEKLSAHKDQYDSIFRFTIAVKNKVSLEKLKKDPLFHNRISILKSQDIISILSTYNEIKNIFLNDKNVLFIDVLTQKPKEELATAGFDLSANKINQVHNRYSSINGSTQNVSVKEQFYDTTDIDLNGRLQPSPLASGIVTNHANFIATIIAGGGNSVYYAKGVAWAAGISSSSFEQVLPDAPGYYNQNNITVQNHSYGTAIDNSYGLNALAFDKSANENPDLLHVLSSGNSGITTDTTGNYSTAPGFANLTGNFKMAKNVLVVGAADSFGIVAPLSSKGPAYDGRIKPELVAFERNGTSEAAALVSGTALLLQEFYKTKNNNSSLPSALAKAILINTADDVSTPGPDYTTGYGSMNAIKAMNIIENNNIFTGIISHNNTQNFIINVPLNIARLKVALVWNDTAASAFTPKALVNDLDLEVELPSIHAIWKPWVLSSFAHVDSLKALPQRKKDNLNNVEQVTIETPEAGIYAIKISGYNIATSSQQYHVVYSMDSLDFFQWYFPSKTDFTEAGKQATLRWESSSSGNGNLEYNLLPGNNWLPVSESADLSKKYFTWAVPDTLAACLLRIKTSDNYFYSDTFLITALLNPKVALVCADSIRIFWEKLKGIEQYQIYQLGEKYMEPVITVFDTSALLRVSNISSKFFSVAPVFDNNFTGAKSYAFNYTLQATGCYINTFLVDQNGSNANLLLSLGTLNNVDSVSFEKQSSSGFVPVFSTAVNSLVDFTFTYQQLKKGVNIFRAKIILSNGQVIYSGNESVYYVESGKYLVFPIPVKRNNNIEIFTPMPGDEVIQVIDVMGRVVLQKQIQFPHEYLATSIVQPGQYSYRIIKNGIQVSAGRLIIL